MGKSYLTIGFCFVSFFCVHAIPSRAEEKESDSIPTAATIGQHIFFDTQLSSPTGQGCVSCHRPEAAFADPRSVSTGASADRTGNRNAPSLMYAALIPGRAFEDFLTADGEEVYVWEGGLFHDGRARDIFEQVQQPFFHKNEMNLASEAALAALLRKSPYASEFRVWVGDKNWHDDKKLTYHAYRALVEFLKEPLFRPFDARIDDYLDGDKTALSKEEQRGLEVFRGAGKCANCHFLEPTTWEQTMLSDFGYDNLGVPSRGKPDPGLGGITHENDELGQFRAPSLRNIALTAPYMHNGSIASLNEVIEFYNRRDLEPKRWGDTDYPNTVNRDDLGDLKLSDQQVRDLVSLMNAFTDRTLLKMIGRNANLPSETNRAPATAKRRFLFPDWTHRLHPAFPAPFESAWYSTIGPTP